MRKEAVHLRQVQQQQESRANEGLAETVVPGCRDKKWGSQREEERGNRHRESQAGLLGPDLIGANRPRCHLLRRPTLPAVCPSWAPPPQGQQKSPPEHARLTHRAAQSRASRISEGTSQQAGQESKLVYHPSKNTTSLLSYPEELGEGRLPHHSLRHSLSQA